MFIEENVNPSGRKTGDCVIRAIAKAENKDWIEVFEALVEIARERYSVPNNKDVYEKYLKKYPNEKVMYVRPDGKRKRYTVEQICEWEGIYVVRIAGHMTVVIDGKLYDIWDCSDSSSYKIWKIV